VVEAVNFNDPEADGDCRDEGGCRAGLQRAEGGRRQASAAVAGFGAVSFEPDEAGRRSTEATPGSHLASRRPRIALVNNVDVAVQTDPAAIRDALYRQAFSPVRWVESVQAIRARGVAVLIECGPGKVLAGTVKRIDPDAVSGAVFDPSSLSDAKALLA
jgi:[acyl-carrier-protein] S-malonyltransferase